MDEVRDLARLVVEARLAPKGLESPEACVVAMLHGLEVGLTPLAALQRIAVIGGRPTIWGDGAMALVRASGLCAAVDEHLDGEQAEDWVAHCTVLRRGEAEPVTRSFSAADAVRAGLWSRPGPWSDYPKRMLQMRARGFALRDVFADVLGGLYLREEVEDEAVWAPPPPSSATPNRPSAQSQPRAAAAPLRAPPPPGWAAPASRPTGPQAGPPQGAAASAALPDPQPEPRANPHAVANSRPADPAAPAPDPEDAHDDGTAPPVATAWPPLARERRLARGARSLRYAIGWSICQPRGLSPSPRLRRPSPAAARRSVRAATLSSPHDRLHQLPPGQEDVLASEPAQVLTDYDNALSCASDPETLLEVHEEFAALLQRIGREYRERARAIHDRHAARVERLGQPQATDDLDLASPLDGTSEPIPSDNEAAREEDDA
jgi:hypothetical protein